MASRSSKSFRSWRKRMGMSEQAAAFALGLGKCTVANYSTGKRYSPAGAVNVPKHILLACAAIESGLPPII